jgi:aspartyl-tRNA synthetase
MPARRSAAELELVDEDRFELCWIVDFPFYDWDDENKRVDFSHNPFSMPQGGLEALEAAQAAGDHALLALRAYQYDLVCNGYEIASGSIRNQLPDLMVKAFELTGKDPRRSRTAVRRALPCLPVWRAAPRWHGGRG